MKSTTESNPPILQINNFSLSFATPKYNNDSFRDYFVNALTSPIEFLLKDDDRSLIIDNLNLKLNAGERLGILGNNGSGKTSLCRYIAGIYGKIENIKINGESRAIFDTEAIVLPELTGMENLEILAEIFYPNKTRFEKKEIISFASNFSELGNYLNVPFKLYSKGMRARLFLSLIVAEPADLLILDEVFNGADFFFNDKISKRTREIIFQSKSAIFISHSLELMVDICTRIIVLDNKKIVFDGTPIHAIKYYQTFCGNFRLN